MKIAVRVCRRRKNMPSLRISLWIAILGQFILIYANSPNMTKHENKLSIGMTVIDDSRIPALRILAKKMNFEYSISWCRNFDELVNKVCFA